MASSIYTIPITVPTQTPGANVSILNPDITFASDEFVPGGAGGVRVWFSFTTTAAADTAVSISHTASFVDPVKLNADNNFVIKSDGLYRFDIPASFGDAINIQSSVALTDIPLLRFEKVVFGA